MIEVEHSFLLGVIVGVIMFLVSLVYTNVGVPTRYFQAEKACKLIGDSVKEYDRMGEVVCTNGVTLDYKTIPK